MIVQHRVFAASVRKYVDVIWVGILICLSHFEFALSDLYKPVAKILVNEDQLQNSLKLLFVSVKATKSFKDRKGVLANLYLRKARIDFDVFHVLFPQFFLFFFTIQTEIV